MLLFRPLHEPGTGSHPAGVQARRDTRAEARSSLVPAVTAGGSFDAVADVLDDRLALPFDGARDRLVLAEDDRHAREA
jgi:hypothetical protein